MGASYARIWQNRISGKYVCSQGNIYPAITDSSNCLRSLDFTTGTTTAGANVSITYTKPKEPISVYEMVLVNNSTVTNMSVEVYNVHTGMSTNSTGDNSLVQVFNYTKEQTNSKFVSGIFNGCNTKFKFIADTSTINTQGFTNYFALKEVY